MAKGDARAQGHNTRRLGTLEAPPEAMAVVHRAARLFRNVTEYEHKDQPDAVACVFQYRKGGRWQWGWAPHDAQFLLSQWLRRLYRATSRQAAITKAMDNVDWQGREVAARLALLGGI